MNIITVPADTQITLKYLRRARKEAQGGRFLVRVQWAHIDDIFQLPGFIPVGEYQATSPGEIGRAEWFVFVLGGMCERGELVGVLK